MKVEKVKLPMNLAMVVNQELKQKYGIEKNKEDFEISGIYFTEEELSYIKSLKLMNPTKCANPKESFLGGITLLPNLESLEIESKGIELLHENGISSITDEDMYEISACTGLQKLSIINQSQLDWIDVSKLSNLKELTIINNRNLTQVDGMGDLENLWEVSVYGNDRLQEISGLEQAIMKSENLDKANLDVLLFPDVIGYNTKTGEYNSDVISKLQDMGPYQCRWKENVNINSETTINTRQMIQVHNKACQVLDENVSSSSSKRDIIIEVENYLAQNVKYDWDAYNHGHTRGITVKIGGRLQEGPKEGANGVYNTLLKNEGVCEGYTKAMQYLLRLKNIYSHNVRCAGEKDTTHMIGDYKEKKLPKLSHSIICIDDYYNLYDDPCWNACYYQQGDMSMPWVLRTQGEISEDHTLFFDERNVANENLKQPRGVITAALMRNELFKKTRVNAINNTRSNVARYIKGQIVTREVKEK